MQNWEKKGVFLVIDKFWKRHDGQIKKKRIQKRVGLYLGSFFIPEKYVFRVCFESFYEDDIQPEIQVPRG